ncbi:MAG: type II CAAX endopeptidase family protein [Calditrichia bacterium]
MLGMQITFRRNKKDRTMQDLRIGRIAVFLLFTFVLSWSFWLIITLTIGHRAYLKLGMSPLDMLFPAFVALALRLFVLRDSSIHFRSYQGKPRRILYGFLLLTVAYGIVTLMSLRIMGHSAILIGIGNLLMTLWTLLVFFVAGQSSKEELEKAGLQLGNKEWGAKLVLGVVIFLALQATLNLLPGLGQWPGQAGRIYGVAVSGGIYPFALIAAFGLALTGIPLSGLAAVFGEEYGWRGFLQDEMGRLGDRRAALVVGLVWGLWHIPVLLSGVHTYPATAPGLGLGLVLFVLWGFFQSYAVLKTGSIWVAAFLHGLVNSVYAFMLQYLVRPVDKLFSFGLGVYGLICLAVVVAFILRDSVWRPPVKIGMAVNLGAKQ